MRHQPPIFEPLEPRAMLSAVAAPATLPTPNCRSLPLPQNMWVPCEFSVQQTTITFSEFDGRITAHANIKAGNTGNRVADWGTVHRDENEFRVDIKFEEWTGGSFPVDRDLPHDYDLGPLTDGEYTFTISTWGRDVETAYLKAPSARLVFIPNDYGQYDQYRLALDASDQIVVEWLNAPTGQPQLITLPPSSLDHLLFDMAGGGDSIVLDLTNGVPLPSGGMAFNTGFAFTSPQSTLSIVNARPGDVLHRTNSGLKINGHHILLNGPRLTPPGGTGFDVVVSGTANLDLKTGQTLGSISLAENARATLVFDSSHPYVLTFDDLSIAESALLRIADPGVLRWVVPVEREQEALRTLNAYLAAGRGDGTWNGVGGIAGHVPRGAPYVYAAAVDRALSSPATSVLVVLYTLAGDLNLDRVVNADDYFRIDSAFLTPPRNPTYPDGDINYDGKINADDYFLIDSAFLAQPAPLASATPFAVASHASRQAFHTDMIASALPDARERKRTRRPTRTPFAF